MDSVFAFTQKISAPFLRIAMGITLLWIGALKFVDPKPVVDLLGASMFSFLALPAFVYLLGVVEVICALLLFAGYRTRYVGLALLGLFAGTLIIFLTTPAVTGLPLLTLPGEFLLKDLVLFAASVTLIALDSARIEAGQREMAGTMHTKTA
jgi:uncharacterized membrane protein YkgB